MSPGLKSRGRESIFSIKEKSSVLEIRESVSSSSQDPSRLFPSTEKIGRDPPIRNLEASPKVPMLQKRSTLTRLNMMNKPSKEAPSESLISNLIPETIRKFAKKMITILPGFGGAKASSPLMKRRSEFNKEELDEFNKKRRSSRKSIAEYAKFQNKRFSKMKLNLPPEREDSDLAFESEVADKLKIPTANNNEDSKFLQPLELLSPGGVEEETVLLNEKMENYYNSKLEEFIPASRFNSRKVSRKTTRQHSKNSNSSSRQNAVDHEKMERLRKVAQHLLRGDEKDIEELENIEDDDNEIISAEKLHALLIQKNKYEDSFFLEIEEKFSFRSILFEYRNFYDNLPLMEVRRRLLFLKR